MLMRRARDRDCSPKSMRSTHVRRTHRDRSGPGSPRRSHRDRVGEGKVYSSTTHHSSLRMGSLKGSRPESFQTLCVRNFSSKLSIEAVQNYLFQDFNEFGDMSISVGHLDGERAALINFKYPEDAQAAFNAKPSVYLHDRTVTVEPLLDTITEEGVSSNVYSTGKTTSDLDDELDSIFDRRRSHHGLSHKMDMRFTAELPAKAVGGSGAVATPSLLGMPSLASPVMAAAAAARALGFGSANPLATGIPPIQPPLKSHNILKGTGHRWFDAQHRGHSPSSADTDQDFKATRTLFIGSLEPDITESEVIEAFERFGYIEQIDIKRSTKVGMHSYAFVRFQNVDMAYRAKSVMSGRCIRSLHCKIGYGKCIPSTCLYIGGLGKDMFVELMHRTLPRLAQVVQVDMVPGRNFAQILFETCEAACEANNQLKALAVGLRLTKRLRIDFIDPETFRNPIPKNTLGLLASTDSRMGGVSGYGSTGLNVTDSRVPGHGIPIDLHTKLSAGFSGSVSNISRLGPMGRMSALHPLVGSDSTSSFHGKHSIPDSLSETRGKSGDYCGAVHRGRTRTLLSPAASMHPTLHSVQNLRDLDRCLQPDLWKGQFVLKKCGFRFRCLHVIGDAELGSRLPNSALSDDSTEKNSSPNPVLHIVQRGMLDPAWMAEATHRIHAVLSSRSRGLCLLLILPVDDSDESFVSDLADQSETERSDSEKPYDKLHPLQALIAYFKLKQAVGLIVPARNSTEATTNTDCNSSSQDSDSNRIFLFAPSSFALSLLKQAAANLGPELATMDKYMVMLIVKR